MTLSTAARVMRAIWASSTTHSVRIGIAIDRSISPTVSNSRIVAIAGSHLRWTASTSTSSVATKNSGTATRHSVEKVTVRSKRLVGNIAATSPRVTEIGTEIAATSPASSNVFCSRSPISTSMVVPPPPVPVCPASDMPRSNLAMSPSHSK